MTDAKSTFTDELWTSIEPIFEAILGHPFVTGLTDGSLSRDRFAFYVVQDAHYLRRFAGALMALGASAPDGEALAMFARHATDALAVERSLHEGFLDELGLHREQVDSAPMAPSNLAYCDFLDASTLGRPFHEGLGAVLPCYWIYRRVGERLLPEGSPDPLYRRWIETYGGEEFGQVVRDVLALADRIASGTTPTDGLTPAQRALMSERFIVASRYEWMFWDAADRLQRWPV